MDSMGGNLLRGSYDIMLTEACEYKRNFLKFNPTMEIILNIDEDHLDYYKDLADIESAFIDYAEKIPQTGHLIVNKKHEPIFSAPNCIVTPHVSYISQESFEELRGRAAWNAIKMLRGEQPADLVN